jgi:hypothetical protein
MKIIITEEQLKCIIKEDTIGSYERQDLKNVSQQSVKAQAARKASADGWWTKYPSLQAIFGNGKIFKKIYYPNAATKETGYVTAQKNVTTPIQGITNPNEYFYSFGPDMRFFIFEGLANWGKQRKYEGVWKVDGGNIEITTNDGDVWNSSTNAWIGTANADEQSTASQTGRYKGSGGFPLLYMQKGGEFIPKLQAALGLKADGLFGPKTNQALIDKNVGYNPNVGVTQAIYNQILGITAKSSGATGGW